MFIILLALSLEVQGLWKILVLWQIWFCLSIYRLYVFVCVVTLLFSWINVSYFCAWFGVLSLICFPFSCSVSHQIGLQGLKSWLSLSPVAGVSLKPRHPLPSEFSLFILWSVTQLAANPALAFAHFPGHGGTDCPLWGRRALAPTFQSSHTLHSTEGRDHRWDP